MLRFGTDGVRGVALTELTPEYVAALGRAAARVIGGGAWLIGRDTRESGPVLEAALIDGLRAGGAEPIRCGVVPTPALAWMSHADGAPAAMLTASHNPYADNGVKIFAAGGQKLSDGVQDAIEAELERQLSAAPPTTTARRDDDDNRMVDRYVAHVIESSPADALAGMRLVVDCANGAMSDAAPRVLRGLGAEVTVLHAEPTGRNINDRCGATHPGSLADAVTRLGADAGLAFDGDGDRVIAVDERGGVIDGDRLIALSALALRDAGELRGNTVVVTVMSNLGFHRAMDAAGIDVVTTPVGDRSVLEALERGGFTLGGEQSGHIIDRRLATTGDGLLAGVTLLRHVRAQEGGLADIAAAVMTTYPQVLVNVRTAASQPDIAVTLADDIAAATATLGGEGRILVRASGTEPLVRVMVEAATDDVARAVADDLAAIVRQRWA